MSSWWIEAVRARVPARRDRVAGRDRVEVHRGQAAVRSVRRVHARDHHRQVERPRAVTGDGLLRDLRHRVRRRVRRVHLADRVGLEEHVHRIVLRPVHRVRRHHERRLRLPAVREQQPGALGVHADRVVEVEPGPHERGEVQHVGEVVGQLGEVAVADVAHERGHADRVDLLACRGIAEACDPPHLVVGREVLRERERDLPGRAGDQDLLARQHRLRARRIRSR